MFLCKSDFGNNARYRRCYYRLLIGSDGVSIYGTIVDDTCSDRLNVLIFEGKTRCNVFLKFPLRTFRTAVISTSQLVAFKVIHLQQAFSHIYAAVDNISTDLEHRALPHAYL